MRIGELLSGLENTCGPTTGTPPATTVCCTPKLGDAGTATPVADAAHASKG